ncbi:MAG: hypothetical protein K8W52_36010 [Deltaproteobacteria bacterium]|nr:hypothetical protein [Deltaproteobacteria bacterium]
MSKRSRNRGSLRDEAGDETAIDRLAAALDAAPLGLHDLGEPSADVPLDWPTGLGDVYFAFNGARLFNEEVVVLPIAEVAATGDGDRRRWRVAELAGEPIDVDRRGRVWRTDPQTGDEIIDGTSFEKWLRGVVDALGELFDGDGEFADSVFDRDGELTAEVRRAQARAQAKRDAKAPGPRWRLARELALSGEVEAARRELERVVEVAPEMPWAWLDLARLSETAGELDGAYDEALQAAEAAAGHEQLAYFWAQAARLAQKRQNEADRAQAAARALAADPQLVAAQLAGAEANLAEGDLVSAKALVELARAVAPRDLGAIDLGRRIEVAIATAPAVVAKPEDLDEDDDEDLDGDVDIDAADAEADLAGEPGARDDDAN